VWHLPTSNDLHHQGLFNGFKLFAHYNLVIVALLDDEFSSSIPKKKKKTAIVVLSPHELSTFTY
jgi:hypothetical protein